MYEFWHWVSLGNLRTHPRVENWGGKCFPVFYATSYLSLPLMWYVQQTQWYSAWFGIVYLLHSRKTIYLFALVEIKGIFHWFFFSLSLSIQREIQSTLTQNTQKMAVKGIGLERASVLTGSVKSNRYVDTWWLLFMTEGLGWGYRPNGHRLRLRIRLER